MTKCESWCGKNHLEDDVPSGGLDSGVYTRVADDRHWYAYCSQACLDRATAEPAPVVWRAGMWATNVDRQCDDFQVTASLAMTWNLTPPTTWKQRDWPATTAPERKLANGWTRAKVWACSTDGCDMAAKYRNSDKLKNACEAHAAEMGVFEPVQAIAAPPPYPSPPKCLLCGQIACSCVGTGAPTRPMRPSCPRCTHRHVGPCNGTSPNGEYSCPCGNLTDESAKQASSGLYAVGIYAESGRNIDVDHARRAYMDKRDGRDPFDGTITRGSHTATLLANLERERVPGRRPIRTVKRYEGNADD